MGSHQTFTFVGELAPRLLAVYKDALERGRLPPSMRSAVITLLHKKGKDPQHCGNYVQSL